LSATSTWHPSRGGPGRAGRALVIPVRAARGRRWAVGAIGLCVLAAAAWAVTRSRVFELRSLTVTGNVHLSSAQVASIGGVTPRTNVLWLSTAALERRLEGNPWIKEARISRTLPSFLSIAILERTPAAVLARTGALVASDGFVLGHADPTTALPTIEAVGPKAEGPARISADLPSLHVLRALTGDLASRVGRIGYDRSGRLILTLREGTRVIFGDGEAAVPKAAALRAVLRWIDRNDRSVAYIDLTVPTAPAVLPSPEQAAATAQGLTEE
jgi:cell division protein FtsQ